MAPVGRHTAADHEFRVVFLGSKAYRRGGTEPGQGFGIATDRGCPQYRTPPSGVSNRFPARGIAASHAEISDIRSESSDRATRHIAGGAVAVVGSATAGESAGSGQHFPAVAGGDRLDGRHVVQLRVHAHEPGPDGRWCFDRE